MHSVFFILQSIFDVNIRSLASFNTIFLHVFLISWRLFRLFMNKGTRFVFLCIFFILFSRPSMIPFFQKEKRQAEACLFEETD